MELADCRRCASAYLGERVVLTPIPTGKFNSSFFVDADDGQFVLRIAPPDDAGLLFYERQMMRQEPELHAILRNETRVPVAEVIVGDSSRSLIDRDFIIMRRLPGVPLSESTSALHDAVCWEVGEALAEVHSLSRDQYGYLGPHTPMPPQDSWGAAFGIMWSRLLDDIVATGHYDTAQAEQLRDLQTHFASAFERKVAASLLHMDVWSQNILVDDEGKLSGLLDWDRALWGDPEIELAVLDYCGILTPGFWRGYGREPDLSEPAQIRKVFYLLYEHQKYIVIRHWRSGDPDGAARYARESLEMVRQSFDLP